MRMPGNQVEVADGNEVWVHHAGIGAVQSVRQQPGQVVRMGDAEQQASL